MIRNKEYKSDVFSMLMEYPQNALDLYNAMNDSHYTDAGLVEINTLDRGISLSVRNDASFVLDLNLSIYEHQSTVCPNMPVRSFVYFSYFLEKYIKKRNIYGRSLVKIPTPHFAVFYNGDEAQPEVSVQRLSDAFERPVDDPDVELVCKVYNINPGMNEALLEKCSFIREYMIFVNYVKTIFKENGENDQELGYCIERAIDRCVKEGILVEFLSERRGEVVKVMQLDYTFDRQLMLERIDSRAEGKAEGLAEGLAEGKAEGLAEGKAEGLAEGKAEGLAEGKAEGLAEGLEKGIRAFILDKLEDGVDKDIILQKMIKSFSISENTASEYYTKIAP